MPAARTVEDFRRALAPDALALVDRLRSLAAGAADGVTEHCKWNAPSFIHRGEDRITLGAERDGRIRVVLHRGAKVKDAAGFSFAAPADLVRWAAADRGVMVFGTAAEVAAREDEIGDVFRRWLEMT